METANLDIYARAPHTDLGAWFESFAQEEIRVLELYDLLCKELGRRTFFNETVTFTFGTRVGLTHADPDALRSMAMTFRQLWLAKEPARFHRVLNLLRQHAKPASGDINIVAVLEELGRRYKRARGEVMMEHVWEDDRLGQPKETFDAERVINDWLNGGQFHSDAEAAARVASWSKHAYDLSLIKALHAVTGVMWELHVVVVAALDGRRVTAAA